MTVAVLAPVLDRPRAALPLAVSLRDTSDARLVFLTTPGDLREHRACVAVASNIPDVEVWEVPFARDHGDYARKVNWAVDRLDDGVEWVFQGADDLRFHDGWLDACLVVAYQDGARVIGTNDLCNPRTGGGEHTHSTHSLVHRSYIAMTGGTFDTPGEMLHPGYHHNFVDDELIAAARYRDVYAHASDAHVQHLHPQCGHGKRDTTYQLSLETHRFSADRRRFLQRKRLYTRRPVTGRRAR